MIQWSKSSALESQEKMGSSTDVPYHPSHENPALEFSKLLPYK
jgi:hypothetical protein